MLSSVFSVVLPCADFTTAATICLCVSLVPFNLLLAASITTPRSLVLSQKKYTMPGRRVFVVGVGMTKFEKPGRRNWDYPQMGKVAGQKALRDAGIRYEDVQQAVVGYVYGRFFFSLAQC